MQVTKFTQILLHSKQKLNLNAPLGPLRRALTRMGAGNLATALISEAMDNSLSYSVLNYLKRLKNQAKMEYDRIVSATPYKGKVGPDGIKVEVHQEKLQFIYSISGECQVAAEA